MLHHVAELVFVAVFVCVQCYIADASFESLTACCEALQKWCFLPQNSFLMGSLCVLQHAVGLIPVALICSQCPKIVAALSEITHSALQMLFVWFLTVALLAMLSNDGVLIHCLLQYAVRLAPLALLHSSYKDKQLTAVQHSHGA